MALGVFFILLGLYLRIHNLEAFSFWTDEGLTPLRSGYAISEILSNRVIIQEGITQDTHPPLYYLILHISRLFLGETDFAYRYPSVLAGVLLIPFLFQFGKKLKNKQVGLVASFLVAINPLQIWYANEARMYTLFVLLTAVTTYLLWRTLTQPRLPLNRMLFLYGLSASLAFYTHYTAVFIIGIQLLFWLWLLWQRGHQKLIVALLVTGGLITLPILPFTIPRLFSGAEANYYYVSPYTMLQDVVHFFSNGLTTDFQQPIIQALDVGILGLLLFGFYVMGKPLSRLFLFSYLTAVVFGLMLGSLLKPMYQGVRHIMVGSPAFLLVLAWAWVELLTRWQNMARGGRERPLKAAGVLLASLILLGGPFIALNNLYHNPKYAKDDFRALIQYIEQHAGPHDIILYNNAILLPLHDHYHTRADLPATALPIYPTVATADDPQYTQLAQTYQRIWYVTDPPADKRDDAQLVQQWLNDHLTLVDEQGFHARTVVVSLKAYATAPTATSALPDNTQPLAIAWPNLPQLDGIQLETPQPVQQPTLWFNFFWEGQSPPPINLQLYLAAADGTPWGLTYQPIRSVVVTEPAPLVRQNIAYVLPLGLPPGTYTLFAQPEGSNDPRPLTEVEVSDTTQWPTAPDRLFGWSYSLAQPFTHALFATNPALTFANGFALRGLEFPSFEVRPGHNLPFTIYWQAQNNLNGRPTYQLDILKPDGTVLRSQYGQAGTSWLTAWPPNALIREDTALYFPPEAEPGRYRLRWQLSLNDQPLTGRPFYRPWDTTSNIFGEITLEPWPLVTTAPENSTLVGADFGPAIQLYSYHLQPNPDHTLTLTLYWYAKAVPSEFDVVFIHIVNPNDQTTLTQQDRIPVDTLRPTTSWREGEFLTDSYTFTLPPDTPHGLYDVQVGLYNPDTAVRLPLTLQGIPQPDDTLKLTQITLP